MKNNYTELYKELRTNNGTYALAIDVEQLDPVNRNYGYKAGDDVIAEAMTRIIAVSDDNMSLVRMGGDEFLLITGLTDEAAARALIDSIFNHNGEKINADGNELSVSLRGNIVKLNTAKVRFGDTFTELGKALGY